MKRQRVRQKENYWISLSDIMTGLMVIFLFISISYINEINKKQLEKDNIVQSFVQTKVELYKELEREFEDDFREDRWNAVLEEDLSIRFMNEKVLFGFASTEIQDEFKHILDDFFPRYIRILMKPEYRERISEVRIEGHTDPQGNYMYNVNLSQARTASVLDYLLNADNSPYKSLGESEQQLLRYWLTANGLSSGRTLDSQGYPTIITGKEPDNKRSRRVEFRIVTKTDDIVDRLFEYINNQ